MHVQFVTRRQVLLAGLGTAVSSTGCATSRRSEVLALPPDHEATLYSSKLKEPIAIVVKPNGTAFTVKSDLGAPGRSLTPAEFAALTDAMEPAQNSRFLPAGVAVYVNFRHSGAVTIEASQSGVRAVVADPTDVGGSGGGSGGGGGDGGP